MKHLLPLLCLALSALPSLADDSIAVKGDNVLTIYAELKTRGEIKRGGLAGKDEGPDADKANFILARTRIGIGFQKGDWLNLKITPQHSAVWGQEGKGSLNLFEAWATLKARFGLFTTIGRQCLSYDDERIFGSDDWSVAPFSHDALKVGWEGHGHKIHGIFAYNQNAANTDGGTAYVNGSMPYKSMEAVWYHYDVPKVPLGLSFTFVNTGMQSQLDEDKDNPRTFHQQLLGTYACFKPKHWQVEGSYYRQMGHDEHNMRIESWMASGKVAYLPSDRLDMNLGFDYLSGEYFAVPPEGGTGLIRHKVIHGFSSIYGSHHKFYGMMDFFYVSTYFNGFTPGLQNLYFGIGGVPVKGLRLNAAYHYLATATKLKDMEMTLGHEVEMSGTYTINSWLNASAGYSFMAGGSTMERLKRSTGDKRLHWAWVSFTISPSIFSTRF